MPVGMFHSEEGRVSGVRTFEVWLMARGPRGEKRAADVIRATRKAATRLQYRAAQFLAIAVLFAPDIASADQLCGRQFVSLSQLYGDLRSEADRGWRVIERSTHVILTGDQMIWAFARDSQAAFPAVACLHFVQVDDGFEAIVQTRCEGAKDACDAVVARANTKDWSNLFGE